MKYFQRYRSLNHPIERDIRLTILEQEKTSSSERFFVRIWVNNPTDDTLLTFGPMDEHAARTLCATLSITPLTLVVRTEEPYEYDRVAMDDTEYAEPDGVVQVGQEDGEHVFCEGCIRRGKHCLTFSDILPILDIGPSAKGLVCENCHKPLVQEEPA